MTAPDELAAAIAALARAEGLSIDAGSVRLEEAGLDFRVAFARDRDGKEWVVRVPRRTDLVPKIRAEARVLAFLRSELSVAVPDWQVHTDALLAYPRLPGAPGLTLDPATKAPIWHIDPTSAAYAAELGRFIAQLHAVDVDSARASGVPAQSPEEVRETWRDQVERVARELPVARGLLEDLRAWLADDTLWPDVTVVTHGELYPAHVLLGGDGTIRGVLDWTTAKVGDPAADFTFQHMMSGPSFDITVRAYREAGGSDLPRLVERCAALVSAGPVVYGIYALDTGDPVHREAAIAQLNPPA